MESDYNQKQEQELAQLQHQLSEALTASSFFEQDTGRLFTQLAAAEITRITRDISSDKYFKDHQGYVNAVTELMAYQKLLRKLQVAASPQRIQKLRERLDKDESR
jgi:hypothetical protein